MTPGEGKMLKVVSRVRVLLIACLVVSVAWAEGPVRVQGLGSESEAKQANRDRPPSGDPLVAAGIAGDFCADAQPIADGVTPFSTLGATTDGPDNPIDTCNDDGENQTHNDIWFTYVATATGNLLVDTCEEYLGSADYDSDLVIYDSCDCRDVTLSLLGCNDDSFTACGTDSFHSALYVPVVQGQCYLIRVGGWGEFDSGSGTLEVLPVVPETGLIDQLSESLVSGFFSDGDCDACESGAQEIAEDFVLIEPTSFVGMQVQGGYFPDDLGTFDDLTVAVYDDAGGAPGTLVTQFSPPLAGVTHTDTGNVLVGTTVFLMELDLGTSTTLPAGTYWVTVYNDTTGSTDTFYLKDSLTDLPHAVHLYAAGSTDPPPPVSWGSVAGPVSVKLLECFVASDCNDGNECTTDTCNLDNTCSNAPSAAGMPCGDPSDDDCSDPDTCDGVGSCRPNDEPDTDGDGACDVIDNCIPIPNPAQEPRLAFGQTVFPVEGPVPTGFAWDNPLPWIVRRGRFVSAAGIAIFATNYSDTGDGTSTLDLTADPPSGFGYWYVWAPNCPAGTYASGANSETGSRPTNVSCVLDAECDDGIDCTDDNCGLSLALYCHHSPNNGLCDEGQTCNTLLGCTGDNGGR